MALTFNVQLKIRKPVAEVFDAVVNPAKLSRYFVSEASGPLVAGQTVGWSFTESPGPHPVTVEEVVANERIVLHWGAADGDYLTRVEMSFLPLEGDETMVQLSESGWNETEAGQSASYDNCGGWMHMACCMKAYLEYGINLRAGGAF